MDKKKKPPKAVVVEVGLDQLMELVEHALMTEDIGRIASTTRYLASFPFEDFLAHCEEEMKAGKVRNEAMVGIIEAMRVIQAVVPEFKRAAKMFDDVRTGLVAIKEQEAKEEATNPPADQTDEARQANEVRQKMRDALEETLLRAHRAKPGERQ